MRARQPDRDGHVEHDGVKIGYEVFGHGTPTLLLLPTWTIVHSRFWKMQVPYLADHYRVVTFDRPGNGRADRPTDREAYESDAAVAQALAVMDATETDRAVLVSESAGAQDTLRLAAEHADRVLAAVFIGNSLRIEKGHPEFDKALSRFTEPYPDPPDGWERFNAKYWFDHYDDFTRFFFSQCFPEPHSTKQQDDAVGWAAETGPEAIFAHIASFVSGDRAREWAARVTVPTLVIHGDDDRISPVSRAVTLAGMLDSELVVLEGSGHLPLARDPVRVNLLIREFVDRVAPSPTPEPRRWNRSVRRRRRALFVSSPIGLGHARRDVAIAEELRRHHPDLEIDWLAQHPVTRMLEETG
ncbi:MAG TPA: alpha/beta hydrolase, partial [Acidimicrobiales bacterium]